MIRLILSIVGFGIIINSFGQKVLTNVSYEYSVVNDWYVYTSCNKYKDNTIKCVTDSVLIYTPIKYFADTYPSEYDTLLVLGYSTVLNEIKEPKIYNQESNNDILRFCWFKDTLPVFYRIEKSKNATNLTFKKTSGNFDINPGDIIIEKKIELSQKQYDKLINTLKSGDYWGMDTNFISEGRNILIESYIDKTYYFINKDLYDIHYNKTNRKILKCFDLLEKWTE